MTTEQEIKKLRHQLGVSEQNYRYTGAQRHRAKAAECKARLQVLGGKPAVSREPA